MKNSEKSMILKFDDAFEVVMSSISGREHRRGQRHSSIQQIGDCIMPRESVFCKSNKPGPGQNRRYYTIEVLNSYD